MDAEINKIKVEIVKTNGDLVDDFSITVMPFKEGDIINCTWSNHDINGKFWYDKEGGHQSFKVKNITYYMDIDYFFDGHPPSRCEKEMVASVKVDKVDEF